MKKLVLFVIFTFVVFSQSVFAADMPRSWNPTFTTIGPHIDLYEKNYVGRGGVLSCSLLCEQDGDGGHCLMGFVFSHKGGQVSCSDKPGNIICLCVGIESMRGE